MAAKKSITETFGDAPMTISKEFYSCVLDDEQLEFANAIWNKDIDIVFVNAKAGTGKTFISVGIANMLVKYKMYDSVLYIMSPYGERKQGYIPGTQTEKSAVYFEAFHQAMVDCGINPNTAINDETMVNQKNGSGYITCITDTYLRGSNISKAVVILDESQNFTVPQLKKVLTRIKDDCKVIVVGHDEQCDLDNPASSGFIKYLYHFKDKPRAAVCTLTNNHRGWISTWADELAE